MSGLLMLFAGVVLLVNITLTGSERLGLIAHPETQSAIAAAPVQSTPKAIQEECEAEWQVLTLDKKGKMQVKDTGIKDARYPKGVVWYKDAKGAWQAIPCDRSMEEARSEAMRKASASDQQLEELKRDLKAAGGLGATGGIPPSTGSAGVDLVSPLDTPVNDAQSTDTKSKISPEKKIEEITTLPKSPSETAGMPAVPKEYLGGSVTTLHAEPLPNIVGDDEWDARPKESAPTFSTFDKKDEELPKTGWERFAEWRTNFQGSIQEWWSDFQQSEEPLRTEEAGKVRLWELDQQQKEWAAIAPALVSAELWATTRADLERRLAEANDPASAARVAALADSIQIVGEGSRANEARVELQDIVDQADEKAGEYPVSPRLAEARGVWQYLRMVDQQDRDLAGDVPLGGTDSPREETIEQPAEISSPQIAEVRALPKALQDLYDQAYPDVDAREPITTTQRQEMIIRGIETHIQNLTDLKTDFVEVQKTIEADIDSRYVVVDSTPDPRAELAAIEKEFEEKQARIRLRENFEDNFTREEQDDGAAMLRARENAIADAKALEKENERLARTDLYEAELGKAAEELENYYYRPSSRVGYPQPVPLNEDGSPALTLSGYCHSGVSDMEECIRTYSSATEAHDRAQPPMTLAARFLTDTEIATADRILAQKQASWESGIAQLQWLQENAPYVRENLAQLLADAKAGQAAFERNYAEYLAYRNGETNEPPAWLRAAVEAGRRGESVMAGLLRGAGAYSHDAANQAGADVQASLRPDGEAGQFFGGGVRWLLWSMGSLAANGLSTALEMTGVSDPSFENALRQQVDPAGEGLGAAVDLGLTVAPFLRPIHNTERLLNATGDAIANVWSREGSEGLAGAYIRQGIRGSLEGGGSIVEQTPRVVAEGAVVETGGQVAQRSGGALVEEIAASESRIFRALDDVQAGPAVQRGVTPAEVIEQGAVSGIRPVDTLVADIKSIVSPPLAPGVERGFVRELEHAVADINQGRLVTAETLQGEAQLLAAQLRSHAASLPEGAQTTRLTQLADRVGAIETRLQAGASEQDIALAQEGLGLARNYMNPAVSPTERALNVIDDSLAAFRGTTDDAAQVQTRTSVAPTVPEAAANSSRQSIEALGTLVPRGSPQRTIDDAFEALGARSGNGVAERQGVEAIGKTVPERIAPASNYFDDYMQRWGARIGGGIVVACAFLGCHFETVPSTPPVNTPLNVDVQIDTGDQQTKLAELLVQEEGLSTVEVDIAQPPETPQSEPAPLDPNEPPLRPEFLPPPPEAQQILDPLPMPEIVDELPNPDLTPPDTSEEESKEEPTKEPPETQKEAELKAKQADKEAEKEKQTENKESREEKTTAKIASTGNGYEGIGVICCGTLNARGYPVLEGPLYSGTPADRAGLREGDVLLSVDGQSTRNKTGIELALMIRGPAGTQSIFEVLRPGWSSPRMFTITRELISRTQR